MFKDITRILNEIGFRLYHDAQHFEIVIYRMIGEKIHKFSEIVFRSYYYMYVYVYIWNKILFKQATG